MGGLKRVVCVIIAVGVGGGCVRVCEREKLYKRKQPLVEFQFMSRTMTRMVTKTPKPQNERRNMCSSY